MAAAVALAAGRMPNVREAAAGAAAFGVVLALTPALGFSSPALALLAGIAAGWVLVRPSAAMRDFILAGMCAALAAGLNQAQGLSVWMAAGACAALLGVGVLLLPAGDKRSAPRQAMLIAAALASPFIAAATDVMAGWQSAQALNRALPESDAAVPLWTIGILVLALGAGCLRGAMKRT